jgi:hypothetical protein
VLAVAGLAVVGAGLGAAGAEIKDAPGGVDKYDFTFTAENMNEAMDPSYYSFQETSLLSNTLSSTCGFNDTLLPNLDMPGFDILC